MHTSRYAVIIYAVSLLVQELNGLHWSLQVRITGSEIVFGWKEVG